VKQGRPPIRGRRGDTWGPRFDRRAKGGGDAGARGRIARKQFRCDRRKGRQRPRVSFHGPLPTHTHRAPLVLRSQVHPRRLLRMNPFVRYISDPTVRTNVRVCDPSDLGGRRLAESGRVRATDGKRKRTGLVA
jgi:hypothetical protein